MADGPVIPPAGAKTSLKVKLQQAKADVVAEAQQVETEAARLDATLVDGAQVDAPAPSYAGVTGQGVAPVSSLAELSKAFDGVEGGLARALEQAKGGVLKLPGELSPTESVEAMRERVERTQRYDGPPGIVQQLCEFAFDSPRRAFAAVQANKAQLSGLTDKQLGAILSALDVHHLSGESVRSGDLLNAVVPILTAHLSPQDKQAVEAWLDKAKAVRLAHPLADVFDLHNDRIEEEIGYPQLSLAGQGQVRAVTTRLLSDGHVLAGRFDELDKVIYDHLQARRIIPGDAAGVQDYLCAVANIEPSPGTKAELLDDPGFELILDPKTQAWREGLLSQLRSWDKKDLDSSKVQDIAKQLWGVPLGADGLPPRVGVRDQRDGKVYPLLDKSGPDGKLLPLPEGLLTQRPNAAYPRLVHDIDQAEALTKAEQEKAAKEGRTLGPNDRLPVWFHDYAYQSDGTGWAMAHKLVEAHDAGLYVFLQYDVQGSQHSNTEVKDGKSKHLATDPEIRKYLIAHGVPVLPFPKGEGGRLDALADDWLSHLKDDLAGLAAYGGGAGNKGDEYSVQSMFHDSMYRLEGPGTATTAEGLAAYWNYSLQETLRREHRDHPELTGKAFDAFIKEKYGDVQPVTPEYLAAYKQRVSQPIPRAPTDRQHSVMQITHWGGHQDENGKEGMAALGEYAQERFVISAPYPTDPFFGKSAIRAEANMKARQDKLGVAEAQRQHAAVIVPAFNDVSLEYWEMLDKYEKMIRAGVEVYEFSGDPMLHNKFEVADEFWWHGSHNGDWRSRYGNNENTAAQRNRALADLYYARAQNLEAHALKLAGAEGLAIIAARKAHLEERLKADGSLVLDKVLHL